MAKRRQQLHEMVLHHVAHMPGLVVVAGAALQADGLGHGDLDMVDVAARPGALEQRVGEAQDEQVLHRLLAEVMVDPVGAALRQDARDRVVDLARRGEIAPQRLFEDDARGRGQDPGLGEVLADRDEEVRRGREIEGADAVGIAQRLLQRAIGLGLDRVEQHHGEAAQESFDLFGSKPLIGKSAGDLRSAAPSMSSLLRTMARMRLSARQHPFLVALRQRRKELAQGEIAARPEDHKIERRHRGALGNGLRPKRAIDGGIHKLTLQMGSFHGSRAQACDENATKAARLPDALRTQRHAVIARSAATKQSTAAARGLLDCFASLAMTRSASADAPEAFARGQQLLGIGRLRRARGERRRRHLLDAAAELHHQQPLAHMRDDGEVVADEDIGQPALLRAAPASRFSTSAWIETSSAEVGSSSSRIVGSSTSARAIATRWRWPPESWCG